MLLLLMNKVVLLIIIKMKVCKSIEHFKEDYLLFDLKLIIFLKLIEFIFFIKKKTMNSFDILESSLKN